MSLTSCALLLLLLCLCAVRAWGRLGNSNYFSPTLYREADKTQGRKYNMGQESAIFGKHRKYNMGQKQKTHAEANDENKSGHMMNHQMVAAEGRPTSFVCCPCWALQKDPLLGPCSGHQLIFILSLSGHCSYPHRRQQYCENRPKALVDRPPTARTTFSTSSALSWPSPNPNPLSYLAYDWNARWHCLGCEPIHLYVNTLRHRQW